MGLRCDGNLVHVEERRVGALERGELDIVWGLPPEYIDKLANSKVAKVSEVPTGTWMMFGMNAEAVKSGLIVSFAAVALPNKPA